MYNVHIYILYAYKHDNTLTTNNVIDVHILTFIFFF